MHMLNKNIWIIANWKSHKNVAEALEWVGLVGPSIPDHDNLKVAVCAPFSDLTEIKKAVRIGGFRLLVGCQDLSPFPEGAYTGEETASILREVVELAILGHSERRRDFAETDDLVREKVAQARQSNIMPLVCVQSADTPIPEGVKLVAYEPIFAIGTGKPDTPASANEVASKLKSKYGEDLEVLYGGSLTADNVGAFLAQEQISGLLIGGDSLKAEDFIEILDVVGG